MILVYCDHITNRHRYIFRFVFEDILGIRLRLTEDREEFQSADGPRLNYSSKDMPGVIQFRPHGLLSDQGVRKQEALLASCNHSAIEQLNDGTIEQWPFDPFALTFYLVSRYEEYLPFEPDEHGRFRPELSLASRENFLRIPLVDVIAHELKMLIEDKYPGVRLPGNPFRFIPSIDIDIAFAHLGKGWTRAAAAWVKLLVKADFKQANERISTLTGKIKDPYDNFHLHKELAEKYGHRLLYFALLGNFSKYDRNTSYKSLRFRKLLSKLSLTAEMGLHPSYRSHLNPGRFEEEKRRLGDMVNLPVLKSRFHYLRLKLPESYRLLISQGIKDDYSLGYSTMNGFRASTCTPFLFYDLQKEEITNLKVHPFIFMDSAMIDHLRITPGDAISEIENLLDMVKKFGGEAIGIWHNYSLCEKDQYKGWQDVLITIFKQYKHNSL
jgi:hypothetical protein